jgi:hypothetical protein
MIALTNVICVLWVRVVLLELTDVWLKYCGTAGKPRSELRNQPL